METIRQLIIWNKLKSHKMTHSTVYMYWEHSNSNRRKNLKTKTVFFYYNLLRKQIRSPKIWIFQNIQYFYSKMLWKLERSPENNRVFEKYSFQSTIIVCYGGCDHVLSQNMDVRDREKIVCYLEVLIWFCIDIIKNFHSEVPEIESYQHHLFFFVIKHAGFWKLQGLENWERRLWKDVP